MTQRHTATRRSSVSRNPRATTKRRSGLKELQLKADGFEKLLESVLSMPHHAFYIFDYASNRMVLGEREVAALYGYTPEEIQVLPEGWISVVHPEDRAIQFEHLKELITSNNDEVMSLKVRVMRKDGGIEWVSFNRRPYARDSQGQVTAELGVVQVITRLVETSSALLHSEARYQAVFERAADGIFIMDSEGIIRDANPQMCQRLGYTQEELVGMHVLDTIPKERHPRAWHLIEQSRASGGGAAKGYHQRKDGTRLPVEFVISPLLDGTQIVIERDITDRLMLEDAARQRDMFYHSLFHNNSSGVARFDEEGRLLEINPKLIAMLGCGVDSLIGQSLVTIMAMPCRAKCTALLQAMQKLEDYPTSLRLQLSCCGKATLHVHAAPTAFHVYAASGAKRFSEGIIILSDITEQVQSETSYQRELEFNKALLSHTTAFIVVMDREGRVVHFNQAVEKRFGFPLEEVRGQRAWDVGIMDARETINSLKRFQRVLGGSDNPLTEIRMFTKTGEVVLVQLSSTGTRDASGEVDRIVVTGTDVTERDRLQREVLRISEREQARIGHDLHDGVGQTMTGMISLIEALELTLKGEAQKDASRISELARESVQEVRRLSHGLSPAAVKNRGLSAALQLLAETVRTNFRTACECSVQEGLPALDEEVETHLFRIAQEAVNNALRHGHSKKVSLSLTHAETEGLLVIEDDGKGLSPSRKKKASGIGLRVMEYRAQLMGGEVLLAPRTGGGVRLTCRFPVRKAQKTKRKSASKARA